MFNQAKVELGVAAEALPAHAGTTFGTALVMTTSAGDSRGHGSLPRLLFGPLGGDSTCSLYPESRAVTPSYGSFMSPV